MTLLALRSLVEPNVSENASRPVFSIARQKKRAMKHSGRVERQSCFAIRRRLTQAFQDILSTQYHVCSVIHIKEYYN